MIKVLNSFIALTFKLLFLLYVIVYLYFVKGAVVVVVLQLPMQLVPITTNVVCSNPTHGEVYSIYNINYVIKFVSDLRKVGGFLPVSRFPLQIKLTATI